MTKITSKRKGFLWGEQEEGGFGSRSINVYHLSETWWQEQDNGDSYIELQNQILVT